MTLTLSTQLKTQRAEACAEYHRTFGFDPTPLLETDWMKEKACKSSKVYPRRR
jgi:hypothetical protein